MSPPLILIIDADADSRMIYTALLESVGYAVAACADGDEACRLAAQQPPGLIITELNPGGRDAWSLPRTLAGTTDGPPPPMLLVTADATRRIPECASRAGYAAWFTKPYDAAHLIDTVRRLLGSPETLAAL